MQPKSIWSRVALSVGFCISASNACHAASQPASTKFAFLGADSCEAPTVQVSGFSTRTVNYTLDELPNGDWAILIEGHEPDTVSEIHRFAVRSEALRAQEQAAFSVARISTWDWGHRTLIELKPLDDAKDALLFVPEDTACLDRFLSVERIEAAHIVFVAAAIQVNLPEIADTSLSPRDVLNELATRSAIVDSVEQSAVDPVDGSRSPLVCIAGGPGAAECSFNAGSVGPFGSGSCTVQCPPPAYACCGFGFLDNCSCIGDNAHDGGGIPPSLPPDPGQGGGAGGGSGGGGGGGYGGPGDWGFPPPGDDEDEEDPGDDDANSADGNIDG
jgi:hypothetical protein